MATLILVILTHIVKCVISSQVYSRTEANLTVVPIDIPLNTTHLHLMNNNITEIFETDFAHLSELLELSLGGNPLISIHANAFMNNSKMTHLYLNYTQITRPPDLSGARNSLVYLKVDNANIRNINDDYFTNVSNLDTIIMEYNELKAVKIGNIGEIKYIYFSNNLLTTMPELLAVLPKLLSMYLTNNQIANVSFTYFNNTPSLQRLFMDNNWLTSLPNFEPVLLCITHIYIRNNYLTSENIEQIAAMPQLSDILIERNRLTNVTFGKSDTLWRMQVSNNQLTEMPTLTYMLPALRQIHAQNNEHLSCIPPEYFNKTPSLTHLLLCNNNLYKVPNLTYCSDTLQYLDLYGTELVYSELHYEDFTLGQNFTNESHIFYNLGYLRLSHNGIRTFSPSFFDGFPNLKKFDCEYNALTEFPDLSRLSR